MSDPTPTPAAPSPPNRSALGIVFLVVFIDLLGFGIVLPLMPRFAAAYLGGQSDAVKGVVIGLLYSSFSIAQMVFSPVWGRISDRIGRRPILIMGLVGSVVFYALFAAASVFPPEMAAVAIGLLLLSRVGAGIAGASVSTAAAVIADVTTPQTRAKGMGLIGAAFGIGFTFGPLIAFAGLLFLPTVTELGPRAETFAALSGTAAAFDPTAPPLVTKDIQDAIRPDWLWVPGGIASALSLVAAVLAWRLLPETLRRGAPHPPRSAFDFRRTVEVLRTPAVGPLILAYFLAIFAFANFEATLSLFTKDVFDFNVKWNFLVFAGIGLTLSIAQGGFYRRFAGKVSEAALMKVGLALMFVGLAGLGAVGVAAYTVRESPGLAGSFQTLFYIAAGVAVFGFAFVNPSVAALVSRRADPTRQGEVIGVNQSFAALGRILGPLVGSVVFFLHPSRALPFAVAAALLVLVVLMLPVIGRRHEDFTPAPPVPEGVEGAAPVV